MKLLLCVKCSDVIKLSKTPKSCECGEVCGGYYYDGLRAWTNGKGYSLAFNNYTLSAAIKQYERDNKTDARVYKFEAYLRHHEGKVNPNTIIIPEHLIKEKLNKGE